MSDQFFEVTKCERCRNDLKIRIMSWFNKQTICMICSDKETIIKRRLRELGQRDHEGCGFIPTI